MSLANLGLDDWFRARAGELLQPDQCLARVTTVDRSSYLVRSENAETHAELSGRLHFTAASNSELPCVGDWVCVQNASPELAIVHAVLPRKSYLRRKVAGKEVDFQMMASNLDVAFIVQSCHFDFNISRLERYIVVAREARIEPIVLLSKTDLVMPEELDRMTEEIRDRGIDIRILHVSNVTGAGFGELRGLLAPGRTYCLLGSSGVGKSTLINRLIGREELATNAVREGGKGSHTTTRRQLVLLDGGAMLIDTPGMRELGLLGASDGVEDSFSEISNLSSTCRFADCTHTQEPGCAVLAAVEAGDIGRDRYQNYLKLRRETEYHDLSYAAKRRKDKEFGRFVKSVKKRSKRGDD